MANQKEYPIRFTPRGLSDAYDSTDTFPGACRNLQNLIFDQANPELIVARPGVGDPITIFESFTTPTFISIHIVIGGIVYGMVSTGRYAGKDEPFAYDIANAAFITISNVLTSNVPLSLSAAQNVDWSPPTMAVIGSKIIVAHAGFSGTGANFFGVIDISTPASPAWSCTNTTTNLLPSVPIAVVNFNNRAWFACKNLAYFSDPLAPTVMTNAGQALTLGDTTAITGFSGLPVQTTSAGVVGALIVFKSFQIWQITGDSAITGSLAQNFLSLNVGCISPRSIVQTPVGTIFGGIDGPYYVSALGQVLPLTKDQGKLAQDLQRPYQNITTPSRACGAYSGSVYRTCFSTILNGNNYTNDYWFDVTVRRWNGPHTFPYDCVSQNANYFVLSSSSTGAKLFTSSYLPTLNSIYKDNGSQLSIFLESAQLPKTQNVNQKQVIESTIELATQSPSLAYTITVVDENAAGMASANITIINSVYTWGTNLWGQNNWSYLNPQIRTYQIPWSNPLVFKKMSLQVIASSSFYLAIGTSFYKYKDCGYTNILSSES